MVAATSNEISLSAQSQVLSLKADHLCGLALKGEKLPSHSWRFTLLNLRQAADDAFVKWYSVHGEKETWTLNHNMKGIKMRWLEFIKNLQSLKAEGKNAIGF